MMATSACSKPEHRPENMAIAKMKSTNGKLYPNLLINAFPDCFIHFQVYAGVPVFKVNVLVHAGDGSENVISKLNSHHFKPPNRNHSNYNTVQNVWDTSFFGWGKCNSSRGTTTHARGSTTALNICMPFLSEYRQQKIDVYLLNILIKRNKHTHTKKQNPQ